jgi:rod shape-determining protein MreC
VHDGVRGVSNLLATRERNVLLEAEIGRLRAELQDASVSRFENVRLRRLLEMRDRQAGRWVGASVVTSVLTRQSKSIVIDRGERDGIRPEQPVVAWGGAVGRVVAVGASHSKVRLLNDPNSGAAAVVQRSRAQGMVVGRGDAPLDLLYVPRFADVLHGDRVVTSGLDGIFPRGFGIGTVRSIEANPDGSQTLRLAGELDYRSLEEVLVLLDPAGLEEIPPAGEEVAP